MLSTTESLINLDSESCTASVLPFSKDQLVCFKGINLLKNSIISTFVQDLKEIKVINIVHLTATQTLTKEKKN